MATKKEELKALRVEYKNLRDAYDVMILDLKENVKQKKEMREKIKKLQKEIKEDIL